MSQRVLLHVGTPKTGTSYLQHVLFHNRPKLRRHGIVYPADRHDAHAGSRAAVAVSHPRAPSRQTPSSSPGVRHRSWAPWSRPNDGRP